VIYVLNHAAAKGDTASTALFEATTVKKIVNLGSNVINILGDRSTLDLRARFRHHRSSSAYMLHGHCMARRTEHVSY